MNGFERSNQELVADHERFMRITSAYEELKRQFGKFKDNLQKYMASDCGKIFKCSIKDLKDLSDLSIGISTPFDATILISLSATLLKSSKLRGKLTIEKLVEDKEKENEKIWELYLDTLGNMYEKLEDTSSYPWVGPEYIQHFFTILLNKFIEQCLEVKVARSI